MKWLPFIICILTLPIVACEDEYLPAAPSTKSTIANTAVELDDPEEGTISSEGLIRPETNSEESEGVGIDDMKSYSIDFQVSGTENNCAPVHLEDRKIDLLTLANSPTQSEVNFQVIMKWFNETEAATQASVVNLNLDLISLLDQDANLYDAEISSDLSFQLAHLAQIGEEEMAVDGFMLKFISEDFSLGQYQLVINPGALDCLDGTSNTATYSVIVAVEENVLVTPGTAICEDSTCL